MVTMESDSYIAGESLGYVTVTTYRRMYSTLRRKFKESCMDLTPEQWGVLVLLWEGKSATQEDLASALCVDKSSMSRVLSTMQDKGLVTRETDPANERKKVICATRDSELLREPGFAIAIGTLKSALRGISPEELENCIKVLNTVKRNLRSS
jgi:DNA-binding MarR family transcriptional regulator